MLQVSVKATAGTIVMLCGLQMVKLNAANCQVIVKKLSVLVYTECSEFFSSFVFPD